MAARPVGHSAGITTEQAGQIVERYRACERVENIAVEFGISPAAVVYYARKAGVPRRIQRTDRTVCKHCGKGFTYVSWHAKRAPRLYCSIVCRSAGYRGPIHGNHKAWATFHPSSGYRMAPVPEGHITRSTSGKKKNRAPEHVIIAEKALGRPLRWGEVVHHINADQSDNRNCNLLVCSRSYHNELHYRMSYLYQREHFGEATRG